ncbi:hypothetical protein FRC07_002209 [Ceratobasidium sp. 392]|nr:hypothetical protein FRC07_002209 [Ceratobasidium sp. 392]
MSMSSPSYGHAAFVLLAEFDIDQGSVLTHQYPHPMGIDEQFIAEMMIPDGVHDQKSDWTIFFLNQVTANTVTVSLIDDTPATPEENAQLLYVLNLVRTVKNPNARRGANVKALALCTPHPYLHIFKPILTMALDDYFIQPDVQSLARLFDAVNAMDISRAPVLSRDEMLIMRATERKDVFAEKFFGTELHADTIPKDSRGMGSIDLTSATTSLDGFETDAPTTTRSRKSSLTSDSTHSHSPPTSLGIKNGGSNEDVTARLNGEPTPRTSLDRASNPVFETVPIWDVLCNINTGRITVHKDIRIPQPPPPLPSVSHASPVERFSQGIGSTIPSTAGIGGTGAFPAPPTLASKTGVLRAEDEDARVVGESKRNDGVESSDSAFMEDICAVIHNHAGELLVRARITDYVQRFVRIAARWEEDVYGITKIDHPSRSYSDGTLGSGATFADEVLVSREMPSNAWRIAAWRETSSYNSYAKDFAAHLEERAIQDIDINHLVCRLRNGRNISDGEAEIIMRSLWACVQTYEQVLLALLPPHHGGLTPLCFGLFHPSENIRDTTVDFMTILRTHNIGLLFLTGLNYFHRFGYVRLAQLREISSTRPGNGSTEGGGLAELAVGQASVHAVDTSDHAIDELSLSLREISLKIHDRPELGWDVVYAHDVLTGFLEEHGFTVIRHYLASQLPGNTAWRGEFVVPSKDGSSLRVVGFNSEMDALPGIGHACGHNLIAVVGVAAAIGLKKAMEKHHISGKIVVLGTPAEESGAGKALLLEAGAYKEMDVCLMAHPSPGEYHSVWTGGSLALQSFSVEYHGHTAHAGAAPWEGKNALDAAFLAYAAVSALRQQIHPTMRVHGMIEGRDWAPNIIQDYAKMTYYVRAPSWEQVVALRTRVNRCFEAGALATSCTMSIKDLDSIKDLQQNPILSNDFAAVMSARYGRPFLQDTSTSASTDFGNVTYELPSIHPGFSIPTVINGGNHTPPFTAAARTKEAHENAMAVSKGLATVGLRVLLDEGFCQGPIAHSNGCDWSSPGQKPIVGCVGELQLPNPEAVDTMIDDTIEELNLALREVSLKIHDRPELGWDVGYAHDVLADFLEEHGFTVTRHYLAGQLPGNTAWKGEFSVLSKDGSPLRVIGLNSEMDALPGIGHACGHNLISVAGVAAALGLKSAMEKHHIPGRVVILGTPAEERGAGKQSPLKAGAYEEMDVCMMAHPGPGNHQSAVYDEGSLALQSIFVEYHGHNAHAGMVPWEGKNALDAAFVAYAAISALRQQIHPTMRVHGMIEGRDWVPNSRSQDVVIQDYAKMTYYVRAPTLEQATALRARGWGTRNLLHYVNNKSRWCQGSTAKLSTLRRPRSCNDRQTRSMLYTGPQIKWDT